MELNYWNYHSGTGSFSTFELWIVLSDAPIVGCISSSTVFEKWSYKLLRVSIVCSINLSLSVLETFADYWRLFANVDCRYFLAFFACPYKWSYIQNCCSKSLHLSLNNEIWCFNKLINSHLWNKTLFFVITITNPCDFVSV